LPDTMTDQQQFITFCYVPDLSLIRAFYEQGLGLELARDQGSCRIYRVNPGAFLGFCQKGEAPRPDGVILTLVCDDVDNRFAQAVNVGGVVEKAPADNAQYGIYHAFLRDPAGYLVEIQRFHKRLI